MKKIKILVLWTLFALVIQSIMLFYIDNKYFGKDLKVKTVKLSESNKLTKEKELVLPKKAKEVKTSFNGRFISYIEDDRLKVFDARTGKTNVVASEKAMNIEYYKWLINDNSFILVEKNSNTANKKYFDFYSYDAKNDVKRELLNFDMKKFRIDCYDKKETIGDIVFSKDSNVMYIKTNKGNSLNDIYMVNIMNEFKKVKGSAQAINKMAILPGGTELVYQQKNIIKSLHKEKGIDISKDGLLLGTDDNQKLYVAKLVNNKVVKVLRGDFNTPSERWESFSLEKPQEAKNIIIIPEGKIVYVNDEEGYLMEVIENRKLNYKGKFLSLYDKGVISIANEKIIKTPESN